MTYTYDYVVLGAGVFGLYATKILTSKGYNVLVSDVDGGPMRRASFVNQARLHNGYHYPRSIQTARKSVEYFYRFAKEFSFAINSSYRSIYAIASNFSYVDPEQFLRFTKYIGVPAKHIPVSDYFNPLFVEAAFETQEYSFDSSLIRDYFMEVLGSKTGCQFQFHSYINRAETDGTEFIIYFDKGYTVRTRAVINATYAGLNDVHRLFGLELLPLKYELAEVILAKVSSNFLNVGVTVMDGPFFSLMPFGLTGNHSLTSVEYTPRISTFDSFHAFDTRSSNAQCTPSSLKNYSSQTVDFDSAWMYMNQLCKQYLSQNVTVSYQESLYTVKTILRSAEISDARPTIIWRSSTAPEFVSVFSGKFNTIYDLEEVL